MALIKTVRGLTPIFGENCFLADNATVVGDVKTGDDCSFWFNTVIRGDVNSIRIGNKVNIQDGAVLHCLYQKSVIEIGDNSIYAGVPAKWAKSVKPSQTREMIHKIADNYIMSANWYKEG